NATGAHGFETETLAEAFATVQPKLATKLADPAAAADAAALIDLARDLGDKTGELVRFYTASGAQSGRGNLRNNTKSLRVWAPLATDAIVQIDEASSRHAAFGVIAAAAAAQALPDVPKAALAALETAVHDAAKANPSAGTDDVGRTQTADAA